MNRLPSASHVRNAIGNSLLRNSVFAMSTTVVNSALGYVFWVAVARAFPAHGVGVATAVISAMTLTALVSELGGHSAMVQLLPKRSAGRDWSLAINAALVVCTLLGALAAILVIALLGSTIKPLRPMLTDPAMAALFLFGVVFASVTFVLDFVFVAERAAGNMLARNSMFAGLKLVLILLPLAGLAAGSELIVAVWVTSSVCSAVFALCVLVPRLGRLYRVTVAGLQGEIRKISSSLVGQHVINLGGTVPMYVLPLLVTGRLSATDNAYFYTTWMVGGLFFMVSAWTATTLFAEGSHDPDQLLRRVRHGVILTAALLAPCAAVMILGGHLILGLFGARYGRGYALLVVLTCSAVPDAITNLYVAVLRVRGRLRAAGLLNVGMAVCTIVAAWFLLPWLGIAGGGAAWLVGETLGSLWVGWDVVRQRRTVLGKRLSVATGGLNQR